MRSSLLCASSEPCVKSKDRNITVTKVNTNNMKSSQITGLNQLLLNTAPENLERIIHLCLKDWLNHVVDPHVEKEESVITGSF